MMKGTREEQIFKTLLINRQIKTKIKLTTKQVNKNNKIK